jgi:hypothetical protein
VLVSVLTGAVMITGFVLVMMLLIEYLNVVAGLVLGVVVMLLGY